MPPREKVLRKLRAGVLTRDSSLLEVDYIGPYLFRRAKASLDIPDAQPLTIGILWTRTRRKTTNGVKRFVEHVAQNARGNQCVPDDSRSTNTVGEFHTQDINAYGYEVLVALLDYARMLHRTTYDPIYPKRQRTRSRASKSCGCRPVLGLPCNGHCVLTTDGTCVPRAHNDSGFVGIHPHPSQSVYAPSDARRQGVRNAARTRQSATLRADRDSRRDLSAGHRMTMHYSRRGNRMHRRPSPKVRLPAKWRR